MLALLGSTRGARPVATSVCRWRRVALFSSAPSDGNTPPAPAAGKDWAAVQSLLKGTAQPLRSAAAPPPSAANTAAGHTGLNSTVSDFDALCARLQQPLQPGRGVQPLVATLRQASLALAGLDKPQATQLLDAVIQAVMLHLAARSPKLRLGLPDRQRLVEALCAFLVPAFAADAVDSGRMLLLIRRVSEAGVGAVPALFEVGGADVLLRGSGLLEGSGGGRGDRSVPSMPLIEAMTLQDACAVVKLLGRPTGSASPDGAPSVVLSRLLPRLCRHMAALLRAGRVSPTPATLPAASSSASASTDATPSRLPLSTIADTLFVLSTAGVRSLDVAQAGCEALLATALPDATARFLALARADATRGRLSHSANATACHTLRSLARLTRALTAQSVTASPKLLDQLAGLASAALTHLATAVAMGYIGPGCDPRRFVREGDGDHASPAVLAGAAGDLGYRLAHLGALQAPAGPAYAAALQAFHVACLLHAAGTTSSDSASGSSSSLTPLKGAAAALVGGGPRAFTLPGWAAASMAGVPVPTLAMLHRLLQGLSYAATGAGPATPAAAAAGMPLVEAPLAEALASAAASVPPTPPSATQQRLLATVKRFVKWAASTEAASEKKAGTAATADDASSSSSSKVWQVQGLRGEALLPGGLATRTDVLLDWSSAEASTTSRRGEDASSDVTGGEELVPALSHLTATLAGLAATQEARGVAFEYDGPHHFHFHVAAAAAGQSAAARLAGTEPAVPVPRVGQPSDWAVLQEALFPASRDADAAAAGAAPLQPVGEGTHTLRSLYTAFLIRRAGWLLVRVSPQEFDTHVYRRPHASAFAFLLEKLALAAAVYKAGKGQA